MEEILKELGFDSMGLMWKHEELKIYIVVDEDDNLTDVVEKIFDSGYRRCQEDVKRILNIRND